MARKTAETKPAPKVAPPAKKDEAGSVLAQLTYPYSSLAFGECSETARSPSSILCLNVNGIRSALKKGLLKYVQRRDPDVVCLGETKLGTCAFNAFMKEHARPRMDGATPDHFEVLPGYRHAFSCSSLRQGYASTAVFVRDGLPCQRVETRMGLADADDEGRYLELHFPAFVLLHLYVPNSGRGTDYTPTATRKPANLGFRLQYESAILQRIAELERAHTHVIYCGDLNVAHEDIDIHNPKGNQYAPGFTVDERNAMTALLRTTNLVDTFRCLHPDRVQYTWFSNFGGARAKKHGWRIDYFLVSRPFFEAHVESSEIFDDDNSLSDHVPILLRLR